MRIASLAEFYSGCPTNRSLRATPLGATPPAKRQLAQLGRPENRRRGAVERRLTCPFSGVCLAARLSRARLSQLWRGCRQGVDRVWRGCGQPGCAISGEWCRCRTLRTYSLSLNRPSLSQFHSGSLAPRNPGLGERVGLVGRAPHPMRRKSKGDWTTRNSLHKAGCTDSQRPDPLAQRAGGNYGTAPRTKNPCSSAAIAREPASVSSVGKAFGLDERTTLSENTVISMPAHSARTRSSIS